MLDELCNDHAEGLDLISELRDSLETYIGRPAARGWFHDAAKNYARHERKHMRREERTVLPLALQVLSKEDWVEIDAALERNEHPLLRAGRRENFDKLFALILQRMPGTVVFGSGQKRVA
jgi:hemerythrin-like domain-containing protein